MIDKIGMVRGKAWGGGEAGEDARGDARAPNWRRSKCIGGAEWRCCNGMGGFPPAGPSKNVRRKFLLSESEKTGPGFPRGATNAVSVEGKRPLDSCTLIKSRVFGKSASGEWGEGVGIALDFRRAVLG